MTSRKICNNCLLVSSYHNLACKLCAHDTFASIDDFVDQSALNDRNKEIVTKLEELVQRIKSESREFDKMWISLWGSDHDMYSEMISQDDQSDFTWIEEII